MVCVPSTTLSERSAEPHRLTGLWRAVSPHFHSCNPTTITDDYKSPAFRVTHGDNCIKSMKAKDLLYVVELNLGKNIYSITVLSTLGREKEE